LRANCKILQLMTANASIGMTVSLDGVVTA
jgi:hypothetical protein